MKKYEYEDLIDFVEYEASIECSNCKKHGVEYGDSAEEEFFEEGWRATRDNVYCPACAKKKLKLNNNGNNNTSTKNRRKSKRKVA